MQLLVTIEGKHSGGSFESQTCFCAQDTNLIQGFLKEFLDSFRDYPKETKLYLEACTLPEHQSRIYYHTKE